MSVEIGTIDTGKLHFVADLDPATTAHPGSIDHDRIEADNGLDRMRPRGLGASLHHDRGADRDHLIDITMPLHGEFDAVADKALDSGRPVIRAQNQFVAARLELIRPENQLLAAKSQYANDIGAILLETAGLRE